MSLQPHFLFWSNNLKGKNGERSPIWATLLQCKYLPCDFMVWLQTLRFTVSPYVFNCLSPNCILERLLCFILIMSHLMRSSWREQNQTWEHNNVCDLLTNGFLMPSISVLIQPDSVDWSSSCYCCFLLSQKVQPSQQIHVLNTSDTFNILYRLSSVGRLGFMLGGIRL